MDDGEARTEGGSGVLCICLILCEGTPVSGAMIEAGIDDRDFLFSRGLLYSD